MSEKLKPCAHCGGDKAGTADLGRFAYCPLCGASTPIAVWNRRAPQGEPSVGCEDDDGLLHVHPESETCEVCCPKEPSDVEAQPSTDCQPTVNCQDVEALVRDDKVEPIVCKCGKPGYEDVCPYQADVNNDDTAICTCCDECRQECANDV